jgi:putative membrane protein
MSRRIIKKEEEENQLRVAQQHLANERTYLAWLRTGLAIFGIGFLTITLHLTVAESHQISNRMAILIIILTCVSGIVVIIGSLFQFLRKRKEIQERNYHSSYKFILFISVSLVILIFLAGIYLLLQFLYT